MSNRVTLSIAAQLGKELAVGVDLSETHENTGNPMDIHRHSAYGLHTDRSSFAAGLEGA